MAIRCSISRIRRVLLAAASGAFLLALLPPEAQADSAASAPAVLPGVVLTQLPGSFSSPVHITNAGDGSNRLFVVEQTGAIRIIKNNAVLPTPFLDIHSLVTCCGEEGLLSVAFHPNYTSNGYFYVYYSNNLVSPGDITLARYHVSANPDVADPTSAQVMLVIPHPVNTNHYGGQLYFSHGDGYLYMGMGDGGSGGDPPNNAQNLNLLLGKMIRIDVDGTGAVPCGQSSPAPYAIPPSNPFVGIAGCDEIWAYGLRNPFRFSFDRLTNDLLIGDVGQNLYEEIDFQPASSLGGENYGWRLMEGFHCYNPSTGCNDGSLTLPILEETHSNGWCAIIGGIRYRGTAIPGLAGLYLYGDNCLGQIWAGTQAGDLSWTTQELIDAGFPISSFGEDEAGEVYAVNLSGSVSRIDPIGAPFPSIVSLSPPVVIAGDPAFTLTVNGSGFIDGSVVRLDGADRTTTFVSASVLRADILASDISAAGSVSIQVFTPPPGGGLSTARILNINPTFLDVSITDFAYLYIQAVYNAHVTAGCNPRLFCPNDPTTRAQMAVFLLKASLGFAYVPPPAQGGVFADVHPGDFAADWIEDLAGRNITGGCGGGLYCPDRPVSRAEMAVFLLKTSQGSAYVPPPAQGGVFADVHPGDFAADWIEDLAGRGLTAGCDDVPDFCPDRSVSRAEMAVFLTNVFSLPLP